MEKSLSKLYFKNNQGSIENEYKNKVKIAELKISNLKEDKRKYYEEWKFNKIEKREFIKLSEEIENKITKLNEDIELYTFTYKENIKKIRKNDYWIGHYKRNRKIKRLTKEVLNELIDVIFVRKDGTLDIKFKYQDEYQSLVNYLEEEAKENEKVDIRNISQAFVR